MPVGNLSRRFELKEEFETMEYRLLRGDANGALVASSDNLDGEFAAITWARRWLEQHADHDRYRLASSGIHRPVLMVRTAAGQWYAIPVAADIVGT